MKVTKNVPNSDVMIVGMDQIHDGYLRDQIHDGHLRGMDQIGDGHLRGMDQIGEWI